MQQSSSLHILFLHLDYLKGECAMTTMTFLQLNDAHGYLHEHPE